MLLLTVRSSHHSHPFHSLSIEDWKESVQLSDVEAIQILSAALRRFVRFPQWKLSTIAQHKEGDNLVARMMIVVRPLVSCYID